MITTFAAGSRALYDWLDGEGRELVRFLPVQVVNSPEVIADNHRLAERIGAALPQDLSGFGRCWVKLSGPLKKSLIGAVSSAGCVS